MEIKTVKSSGQLEYDFVKIGQAYFSDDPLTNKNGKLVKFDGKEITWNLKLKLLVDESILDAEQSCYLVCDGDKIIYVGYYSNSFRDRWWKKNGYFWHGEVVDKEVKKLLTENPNKNITVWLSINPYATIKGVQINISKFIEDDLIMSYAYEGLINTVGKNLKNDKLNTKPVATILGLIT